MKMINPKYMIILAIGIGSIMNLISVLLKPNFLIFVNVFITYFGFEILYYKLSNDKFRWFYILSIPIFIEFLTTLGLLEICSINLELQVCNRNPFILSSLPLILTITFFLAYLAIKILKIRKI
jgi:hypothetical protein